MTDGLKMMLFLYTNQDKIALKTNLWQIIIYIDLRLVCKIFSDNYLVLCL